jgi:hypothetical protein
LILCGWKLLKPPIPLVSQAVVFFFSKKKASTDANSVSIVPSANKEQLSQPVLFDRYTEDDDTATDTGRTLSSIADNHHDSPPFSLNNETSQQSIFASFEKEMKDPQNGRVSRYQNTYFMDGGNRFISVRRERGQCNKFSHMFLLAAYSR